MKYKIAIILFAVIIIVSGILTFVPLEQACKVSKNSCEIVQTSKYETTFGIKNSHLGLVSFLIMFLITLSHIRKPNKIKKILIKTGITLGTLFAIYFLYLQFIVLNAVCPYCLTADIATILSFIVLIFTKEKSYKKKSEYQEIKNISLEITK